MKRPAFTLIELITIIAILGSIVFITLPGLSRFSANLSLQASAKTIITELRQLQTKARLTHTTQLFKPDQTKLPSNISYSKIANISFAASGFPPPGGSGTIVLRNRFGRQKKIIVASSGRVRFE